MMSNNYIYDLNKFQELIQKQIEKERLLKRRERQEEKSFRKSVSFQDKQDTEKVSV